MTYATLLSKEDLDRAAAIVELRKRELTEVEKVALQINNFDWSYDYSDDSRVWRAGEASEKRNRELIDNSGFDSDTRTKLLCGLVKSNEGRAQFRAYFPFLEYHYEAKTQGTVRGVIGAYLDGVPAEDVVAAIAFKDKLYDVVFSMQPLGQAYFIKTHGGPSVQTFREKGLMTVATHDEAQQAIFALFDNVAVKHIELVCKYLLAHYNTEKRFNNFDIYRIEGTTQRYLTVSIHENAGWRHYNFCFN